MPRVELKTAYRVDIIERERGWGSKVDETIYFDDESEARAYAEEYNRKYNPPGPTPDWYMVAQYRGKVN